MINFETRPPTEIDDNSLAIYEVMKSRPVSILCGRNNSGKSFVLRKLLNDLGNSASYLGPARYQNFNVLGQYGYVRNRKEQKWNQQIQHFRNQKLNQDNSPTNLQSAIAELSDEMRGRLFEIVGELLDVEIGVADVIPGNSMSQKYINVDGYNISYTSSGFRLVATLVTSLLDTDYKHFLIDEPELGLSPEIQASFADWLLNPENREKYLDHIETVILATHSPIFLDRKEISNNHIILRNGNNINIKKISTVQEINHLQFKLLGNRFETLFLPSAIVLVEGPCDYDYLSRLISLRFQGSLVSVIRASGDGRFRAILAIAKQMLGDIRSSPYANRIFAVLDSRHGEGLRAHLERDGIPNQNIVVWEGNGIEYVYPRSLLTKRFGDFELLDIEGDRVRVNGLEFTKMELVKYIVDNLRGDEQHSDELEEKLLTPLQELLI